MILRDAVQADTSAVLELSRLPMPGKISLIWGLHSLCPPPECRNLHTVVVERDGRVAAAAMRWDWPNGDRYLGGLRLGAELRGCLPRPLWTRGYEAGLEGVEHAWTSIGAENLPALRLLAAPSDTRTHRSGLPCYSPRQEIRSWFVPLSGRHRRKRADAAASLPTGVCPDDHRYAAVAAGGGLLYGLARLTYSLGLPGLPPPGKRIRIAHADLPPGEFASARRRVNRLDGLIISVPKNSALAERWRSILPRYAVAWDSILYSVHWDPEAALPPVPNWKGYWL